MSKEATVSKEAGEAAVATSVTAAIAAVWAAVAAMAPMLTLALLAWLADSRSSAPATDAVRLALDSWLLAHGVPLTLAEGTFGLTPLLITGFVCWQLGRAGATTARAVAAHSWGAQLRAAASIAVCYGAIGAGVAFWARLPGVQATPWLAAVILAVLALVASLIGGLTGTESGRGLLAQLPAIVRNIGRAVAVLSVLAAAAVLALVMLAISLPVAADMTDGYSLGAVGGIGLLLLCLVYLPTLLVWSVAYVVGTGFAIGAGTGVSVTGVQLDSVPAFPLLAAVPTTPGNTAAHLLLALPVLAGLIAGLWFSRRYGSGPVRGMLLGALAIGAVSGAALGGLAGFAHGSLGPGSLSSFGPQAWQVAAVAAIGIGAGSAVGAAVHRWAVPWTLRLFPGPAETQSEYPRA
ncbi:MAG: cell division protein PerM [Mycobacteriales bacterium]